MRDALRRWQPLVRAVAISLALGVLATPIGIAHLDATPDVCEPPASQPDSGTARLSASSTTALHDHCFTCHWLQSFRSTLLASGFVLQSEQDASPLPSDAAITRGRLVRVSVPARAPPA